MDPRLRGDDSFTGSLDWLAPSPGPRSLVLGLSRQRIRPHLDMHRPWLAALAALHEPRRAVSVRAPESAALPARVRIVDAPIESLGVEPQRIRDAQHDHLAVLQRDEAVVQVGGGHRNVVAEPQRVVLIYPGVIARLGA